MERREKESICYREKPMTSWGMKWNQEDSGMCGPCLSSADPSWPSPALVQDPSHPLASGWFGQWQLLIQDWGVGEEGRARVFLSLSLPLFPVVSSAATAPTWKSLPPWSQVGLGALAVVRAPSTSSPCPSRPSPGAEVTPAVHFTAITRGLLPSSSPWNQVPTSHSFCLGDVKWFLLSKGDPDSAIGVRRPSHLA